MIRYTDQLHHFTNSQFMAIQRILADQDFNGIVYHLIGEHFAMSQLDMVLHIRISVYVDDQL